MEGISLFNLFEVEGIKIMYIQMSWLNYVLLGSTSCLQESVI